MFSCPRRNETVNDMGAKLAMRGFSVIELVITVAIVAILTTIAYPSYQQYFVRSRRIDAEIFMMDVANREKQYLLDAREYALDPGGLAAMGMSVPAEVAQGYTIALDAGTTTPSFVITATPISGGRQESDGSLSLDHTGIKIPSEKW